MKGKRALEKIIHICFSDSAKGVLSYAVNKKNLIPGEKVIALQDDLSLGNIKGGINLDERISLGKIINEGNKFVYTYFNNLKETYSDFYTSLSKFKAGDIVYLWYGECGREFCGMLYTLELLKDKNLKIYTINVSDIVAARHSGHFVPKSVGELMGEQLDKYINIRNILDEQKHEQLLKDWVLLKEQSSMLRIYKDGKIIGVQDDYFDIDILKYTGGEYKKSARIVGYVLGYSKVMIFDDVIFWRIKELTRVGKLQYRGEFGSMIGMEIRITEKGLKHLSKNPEAMEFWMKNKLEIEKDILNRGINQGRFEEKINIAKKLLDVLEVEVIAEKTGLSINQIKNLSI